MFFSVAGVDEGFTAHTTVCPFAGGKKELFSFTSMKIKRKKSSEAVLSICLIRNRRTNVPIVVKRAIKCLAC